MNAVHVVVGIAALVVNAAAAVLGAWCWWRAQQSAWFWRLLRTGQVLIVLAAALGGIEQLGHRKAAGIHILYGVLPIAVSFVAEQLRVASAQMVLDARGFENSAEVGTLPADEQREVVIAIVQREVGVMALAAIVIVVLLARAAGTA